MVFGLRDNSPRPNARKGEKNAKPDKSTDKAAVKNVRQRVQDFAPVSAPPEKTEKPEPAYPRPTFKPAQSILEDNVRFSPAQTDSGLSGLVVRLSPSLLIMLSILLVVTLSFFFVFGLVIGRGTVPPVRGPELERLLPETEIAGIIPPERILPAENLHFMSNLRAEGEQDTTLLTPEQAASVQNLEFGPSPYTGIPANSGTYQEDTPPAQLMRYDFVLQAAAFKVEQQADALRLRLEDAGMRTKLVRETAQSGTWYHVQILYRGTEDNFQTLRDSLPSFGIRDSILASKNPVD